MKLRVKCHPLPKEGSTHDIDVPQGVANFGYTIRDGVLLTHWLELTDEERREAQLNQARQSMGMAPPQGGGRPVM